MFEDRRCVQLVINIQRTTTTLSQHGSEAVAWVSAVETIGTIGRANRILEQLPPITTRAFAAWRRRHQREIETGDVGNRVGGDGVAHERSTANAFQRSTTCVS